MTDTEFLARIDENVKYLRISFDEHKEMFKDHIAEDKRIQNEYIKPLWEERAERRGAIKLAGAFYVMIAAAIGAVTQYSLSAK